MDEPASALDPIATSKIEDLIDELKKEYTVVIVTHSMQQAARISDYTAFFLMGEIDRDRDDVVDIHQAQGQAHRRLHHRAGTASRPRSGTPHVDSRIPAGGQVF